MSLRINTNIAALNAHNQLSNTDSSLTKSLERLSSGLRINRAADDASGMAIADALRAQALGIKQAVANANDGISIVQIADGALQETINIVNIVKTKAIQAAQDGQTMASRKAIQSDIDKLIENLDMIANTTTFNGQKLLSGVFTNKKFQIGAYSGERINISIRSAESTKIGHVNTGELWPVNPEGGKVQLTLYSNLQNRYFDLNAIEMKFDNSPEHGMGALASAINKLSDALGITASAVVEKTTTGNIKAGSTGSDFAINGINIGRVNVVENDTDGSMVKAFNAKSDQHGVLASTDANGRLTMTSVDGRGIKVTGFYHEVLGAEDLDSFGFVRVNQMTSNEIVLYDRTYGQPLGFDVDVDGDVTTSIESKLIEGSVLQNGSVLRAGTILGFDMAGGPVAAGGHFFGDIVTTEDSVLKAGTKLGDSSVIAANSVFGGNTTVGAISSTDIDNLLKAGSLLKSGTVLAGGTQITMDIETTTGSISAGSVLQNDVILQGDHVLTRDMMATAGSSFEADTEFAAGSHIGADATLTDSMILTQDMVLLKDSTIDDDIDTIIKANSTIGGTFTISGTATVADNYTMTISAGSIITSGASFTENSTLGGHTRLNATATVNKDMTVKAGSVISSGSVLAAGTRLTNDFITETGIISAGTVLERDYSVKGDQGVSVDMTITKGSQLVAGSVLGPNSDILSATSLQNAEVKRLSEVKCTSQDDAQIAISIAEAALRDLGSVRSDLGSVQNQLSSTIANLTVTKVNVFAAESGIRDVDFAEESAIFSKMQVLMQAGTFAMSQANASQQNVLQLLQG